MELDHYKHAVLDALLGESTSLRLRRIAGAIVLLAGMLALLINGPGLLM